VNHLKAWRKWEVFEVFIIPASARSWVPVNPDSHFSLQNLPFGLLAPVGGEVTLATAIGDHVVNLTTLRNLGLLDAEKYEFLDSFAEFTNEDFSILRREIFELLVSTTQADQGQIAKSFSSLASARMLLPIKPAAFVDFYSGMHHASNVGRMFRPDQPPLLPNYLHIPVGYNGRASSVVVSGTPIHRPSGQTKGPNDEIPAFGPTKEMDFELEMGFYVGMPSAMGSPVHIDDIPDHILGYVLVNDWSARDLQRWEYQPLGPFLAKSFATSVSPWVVLPDALEPFRIQELTQEPAVLPYLQTNKPARFDMKLEVGLKSAKMREYQTISSSNSKYLYWTFDQQLAHQSSNGTPLSYGDLYASGTISGPIEGSYGSMLELSWRGQNPIELSETGETRTFLENGDSLVLTGFAQGQGYRVGFGSVEGTVQLESSSA
jgi:fumarylacetoacetase